MLTMNEFSPAEKREYAQYRAEVAHKLHQEAMRKLFNCPKAIEIKVTITVTAR